MELLIIGAIALFFLTKAPAKPSNTYTVTGGGGTSTPKPASNVPAFYQESNSADNSSTNPMQPASIPAPLLGTSLQLGPTDNDISASTEQTSNGNEQTMSYANNGIVTSGVPVPSLKAPVSDTLPFLSVGLTRLVGAPIFESPIIIAQKTTSPVGTPPAGTGLHPAADIAPLPLKTPTIEATTAKVSENVLATSYIQPISTSLKRQSLLESIK